MLAFVADAVDTNEGESDEDVCADLSSLPSVACTGDIGLDGKEKPPEPSEAGSPRGAGRWDGAEVVEDSLVGCDFDVLFNKVDEPADRAEVLAGLTGFACPPTSSLRSCIGLALPRAMTASGGESIVLLCCGVWLSVCEGVISTLTALSDFFCIRLRLPKKRDNPPVLLLAACPTPGNSALLGLLMLFRPLVPVIPPPSVLCLALVVAWSMLTRDGNDADFTSRSMCSESRLTLPLSISDCRGRGEESLIFCSELSAGWSVAPPWTAFDAAAASFRFRTQEDEAAGGGNDCLAGSTARVLEVLAALERSSVM